MVAPHATRLSWSHRAIGQGLLPRNPMKLLEKVTVWRMAAPLTRQGPDATLGRFLVTAALAIKVCPVCKGQYSGGEVFCPIDATRLMTPSQMTGAPTSDPEDPLIGQELAGRYKILKRIGEGGMGLVYEGVHTVIEKRVAIKVLREDFSKRTEVVERFRQEAKSASRIGHENIVDISDFGETPTGASYFVMEFLDGEDLANLLAREATVEPQRSIDICMQCCRALEAAHSKGIVHRDMKPENIFLTQRDDHRDFVKIVDFGIAKMSDIETDGAPGRKLTKTGMIFGTPEYMSPEQASGKALDHRVDIYAMGVILYETVTGRVPFVGDSFMGILTQHMFEEPPPLRDVVENVKCSAELEMVIFKALAKDPDARYQSMEELGTALEEAAEGRVSDATLIGFGEPVKSRARGPRAVKPAQSQGDFPAQAKPKVGLIVAGIIALLAIGGGGAWVALQPDEVGTDPDVTPLAAVDPTPDPTAGSAPTGPDPTATAGLAPTPAAPTPAAPPEPTPAAPTLVDVRVETRPSGARVFIEGGAECPESPCTLQATAGEVVTIRARRGRMVGSTEITPEGATAVQIALVARRGGRRTNGSTPMTTMSPMNNMRPSGDLKIPDIFR